MIEKTIEELLYFATINLDLNEYDLVYKRNLLLHMFNKDEPYKGKINKDEIKSLKTPKALLDKLYEDRTFNEFKSEEVMSILSLSPSVLINNINNLKEKSVKDATSYFYNYMIKNNYIKKDNIDKNIKWDYDGSLAKLEITINLSKPEKSNKDIREAAHKVSNNYPSCRLCFENVGYYGNELSPARSNLRYYPIKLAKESWFIQHSPYAYYNEHIIIINKKHTPMIINSKTVEKELDFLDEFPNYFVGSNADLPIVGGSMLSHEHYQGGGHTMPMMKADSRYNLYSKEYRDLTISYLDWYNSCITVEGKDKKDVINCATHIIDTFNDYKDESIDLINKTKDEAHSTSTVISEYKNNKYRVYIILRNNRTNQEYKEGIFHAHKEYFNIKSEGIGLIEAMGLFILPPRLKDELELIKKQVLSNSKKDIESIILDNPSLEIHRNFIYKLIDKYGRLNKEKDAQTIIRNEVGMVCENILKNTGIFKDTLDGQVALFKFFDKLNFEVVNE